MITIIALIGKTSSGKDTASRFIESEYGIKPIVSYATRPIRETEIDGREHYFINDLQMDKLLEDEESILAFVQFPKTGYRYCASTKGLSDNTIRTYIIDPSGLEWLKANRTDVKVISIFFDLSEDIIIQRALGRGDKLKDIESRLDSERKMFEDFSTYDVKINTNDTVEHVQTKVKHALKQFGIR